MNVETNGLTHLSKTVNYSRCNYAFILWHTIHYTIWPKVAPCLDVCLWFEIMTCWLWVTCPNIHPKSRKYENKKRKKPSLYLPKDSLVHSEQSLKANKFNKRMAKARSVDRQKSQRMRNKTETLDTRTTKAGTLKYCDKLASCEGKIIKSNREGKPTRNRWH